MRASRGNIVTPEGLGDAPIVARGGVPGRPRWDNAPVAAWVPRLQAQGRVVARGTFWSGPLWSGMALAALVALAAWGVGLALPLLGAAVAAIVLGVLVRALFAPGPGFDPGIRFTGRKVLQWSIVGLGFGLDVGEVARSVLDSLGVMLWTMEQVLLVACTRGTMLRLLRFQNA